MPVTLNVYGKQQLMARLVDLRTARLANSTEEGIKKIVIAIRDDAKAFCPVGTPESTGIKGYVGGSLRDSIRLQTFQNPGTYIRRLGVSAGGYVVNPNSGRKVDYAAYVEKGTSKMLPRPFLRNAIERHKDKLPRMYRGRRI